MQGFNKLFGDGSEFTMEFLYRLNNLLNGTIKHKIDCEYHLVRNEAGSYTVALLPATYYNEKYLSGKDLSGLKVVLGEATEEGAEAITWNYGAFLQTVLDFLIIAICLFAVVKGINKMKKPAPAAKPARTCPFCKSEIADDATRCPHCTSELKLAK